MRLLILLLCFIPLLSDTPTANSAPLRPLKAGSFPIAVWLQEPSLASSYKKAGFNLYVGLWKGPTEEQLTNLKAAEMPVICEQNEVGLKHLNDPTIFGWMQQDEPDNAQPLPQGGYGPCVPPQKVVDIYHKIHTADPSRPSMLNLGQGIANDEWNGRGSGAKLDDYRTYVEGGDIISYDIYPIAQFGQKVGSDRLWYVAKGISRLINWIGGKKPVWCCIECTNIGGVGKATPEQVRSEVWMAIISGARGLIYFVHQFKPTFDEHALLDDPEMLRAVSSTNQEIETLAPIINSPPLKQESVVASSKEDIPISIITRMYKGMGYLFSVGMRNGSATASFHLQGLPANGNAEVIGENRTISVKDGRFQDDFSPYQVHIYRIISANK